MFSEEKLINYKQNFTGVKFQWIKPDDPSKLGTLVTCKEIFPKGNDIIAKFDDGSTCFASQITKNLLMIQGDMPPLSKEEVASIYGSKRSVNSIPTEPSVKDTVYFDTPNKNGNNQKAAAPPLKSTQDNPFKMFNSEETNLSIKLKINLPDKKLLKLMYNNAEDKEVFLKQLSGFVLSMINNKVVKESMLDMFDPKLKAKPITKSKVSKKPSIKVTEVKNG